MEDLWVFGYGSLMWRPGFEHTEVVPALLRGLHRSLCVFSWVHRGTQQQPGLVLGLDRGGACRGLAFRVEAQRRDEVVTYLRDREQVTMVYREVLRDVVLDGGRRVRALGYVVERAHEQYAGALPLERQLEIVRRSHGQSGPNRDYVLNTADHLSDLGIRDSHLHWLAEALRQGE
ncbi:cation transport protein ChaC [Breoghania corrubedonensis]|uniref:glutathione-specific gamma-glutamylcyclotransferase n=1 Tax=Breoghania corrubedonensis TaxID=665038 RepID=A0A2T5VI18_9HYPH|nr:gamma-glutamylcyclotransferase [Breoghania corrubedonensis]PTW63366.1 cation transport protein ChaC [Breoghania corrubedonensis]